MVLFAAFPHVQVTSWTLESKMYSLFTNILHLLVENMT